MENKELNKYLNLYGKQVWGKWNAPRENSVYIGRGSIFGNPYPMKNKSDEERIKVILLYKKYLVKRIKEDCDFKNQVLKLYNKNLICFCSNGTNSLHNGAKYCHGHILKAISDYLNKSLKSNS